MCKGDFTNFFKEQEERFSEWPMQGIDYWSYKKSAERLFAGKITAIEKSNDGFVWNWAANDLKGKYFVANFGYQEYISNDVDANGKFIIKQNISCAEKQNQNT